ncbi:MAG: diaminopimelate decarboxylase [Polyangiales bacterium]|nr:diaminopimelate decarboxylase [Myxococcales bacterium]MCB9658807.1 diaminopimelate decarboxylase [Sandaracinaceae bacterium]
MASESTAPDTRKGAPASAFHVYADGELTSGGVPLSRVAEEFDTPTYVYAPASIDARYRAIDDALSFAPHLIAYAVKANGNLAILRRLAALGCGADIVSAGELHRALRAGIPGSKIVFSGVGKKRDEICAALHAGVKSLHVESAQELDVIEAVARKCGARAPVSLRINPDVDPQTHPYIATGLHGTKFGIETDEALRLVPRIVASEHLEMVGVACHIGSQLGSAAPLEEAVTLLGRFALTCRDLGAPIREIDVGGGWPLDYGHEPKPYPGADVFGAAIRRGLEASGADALGAELITEPGRSLVGEAGVLLARVVYVKENKKRFVIVDAAMNDLVRPALYSAYHAVQAVREPATSAAETPADLVGPVCESGDFLARDRVLPPLAPGELVAIRCAGAYGREMASTYNARPVAAEVFVENGQMTLVRRRGDFMSLWAGEEG